jgi:hypothetical protein
MAAFLKQRTTPNPRRQRNSRVAMPRKRGTPEDLPKQRRSGIAFDRRRTRYAALWTGYSHTSKELDDRRVASAADQAFSRCRATDPNTEIGESPASA